MAEIKGITIPIKGDATELQKALGKIRTEARDVDKELGYINKSLKFNPKNVDLWRQKQDVLNTAIKKTDDNLAKLRAEQEKLNSQKVEKNSNEYRELEREIIRCESKLKSYKKELQTIPTAKVRALAEGFKEVGAKMTDAGKTMTRNFTVPITAAYTLAANLGSDYEENLNKIDVAFGGSAEAVKDWANTAREQFGLSKVQATQAVSAFGALGKGIGLSESDAAQMSTTLAGLSADLGSYFNVSTEESAKALEGIFTGEAEALKKFGVVMNETNLKQFAEDQGLVYSELSQTEKTMLRYQYVLAMTKDAQGDFSRTSDGTANSTKIFKAALQDLGTAIGTQLLPIITPLIQKVADFIGKIASLPEPVQKVITIVGLVVAALGPLLVIIGSLASAIGTIITVAPAVSAAITTALGPIGLIVAAVGAFVSALVYAYNHSEKFRDIVNAVFNTVKEVVGAVIGFIKERMAIMLSSFTQAIDFIKSIPDRVRAIVQKIKDFIKLPHFKLTGELSLIPPSVPKISVDWYANGGIFTKPTVFGGVGVGDVAGGEAVLPLAKLWEEMDKRFAQPGLVVNVYGSDNMSVDELAMKVQEKIITLSNRRRQAWA